MSGFGKERDAPSAKDASVGHKACPYNIRTLQFVYIRR